MSADGQVPPDCPGLDNCPPAITIHDRIDSVVTKVGVLAEHVEALAEANRLNEHRLVAVQRGHEYLAQQMGDLSIAVDKRISDQTDTVKAMQADLRANTEATIRLDERSRQNHELLQGVSDAHTGDPKDRQRARLMGATMQSRCINQRMLPARASGKR